jgi:hypothetical protein
MVRAYASLAFLLLIAWSTTAVYAEAPGVIQVPIATIPITRDGHVTSEEYADARNYSLSCTTLFQSCTSNARFYVKYDANWTYFALDDPDGHQDDFDLDLGSKVARDSIYRLYLDFSGYLGARELPDPYCCTPFSEAFVKGRDYSWQFSHKQLSVGLKDHMQFEVQIRTALVFKQSGASQFGISTCCQPGIVSIPKWGSTFADLEFITPPKNYYLTLRTPSEVAVDVDGVKYPSGVIELNSTKTSHEISAPRFVDIDQNTRLAFEGWNDGVKKPDRTIAVDANITLEVEYYRLYRLTLASEIGNVTGAGWYSSNSTTSFSVSPTGRPLTGIMGLLGGQLKLAGWYENGKLVTTSPNGTIIMNKPHSLETHWYPDYSVPLFTLGAVASVAVLILAVTIFGLRKRRQPHIS